MIDLTPLPVPQFEQYSSFLAPGVHLFRVKGSRKVHVSRTIAGRKPKHFGSFDTKSEALFEANKIK